MLLDASRVMPEAVMKGVAADWFDDAAGAAVWEALLALHGRKSAIDMLLVVNELRQMKRLDAVGGAARIEKYVDGTPTAANAAFYLDTFAQEMMTRGVERVFRDARDDVRTDPAMAIGQIMRELRELMDRGCGTLEVAKRPLMERKLEQWTEVARQRFELHNPTFCMGVPLPWGCLNSVFSGLRPGLHVVGARTSVGKTVYATNVSQYWCETGVPHAFVSLDMPGPELLTRYISQQARVSLRKLEWGARKDELAAAREQVDVVDRNAMRLTEIRHVERLEGWLNMAVERWGIRAVIVDYVQLVRMKGDRRMRAFERVCEVVQILKDVANNMRLPFILLAQLSREVDKAERENVYAEPRLSDLGDSSELEKAAASVTLMYRDQIVEQGWQTQKPTYLAYGDETLARHLRAMWLKVEKNQQGLAGVRRPFVMYPHQFILRPGCYECREPLVEQVEDPFTGKKRKVVNWTPAFRMIRDDWRVLEEDEKIGQMGGLGKREYQEGE